jgi:hypothetical protein
MWFALVVIAVVIAITVENVVEKRADAKVEIARLKAAELRARITDEADRIRQTESSADRPS